MNYIICATSDILSYEKNFLNNDFLKNEKKTLIPLLDKSGSKPFSLLYNTFLDDLPDDAHWLIFTHDHLEFLEDPLQNFLEATEDALYGAWGARLAVNNLGELLQECIGEILVQPSAAQSYYLYNKPATTEKTLSVETLDSMCLVLPSKLVRQYALRFDSKLHVVYGEDFCLRAFDTHGIPSKTLPFRYRYHGNPFPSRGKLEADMDRCTVKYANSKPRAGVHSIFGGEDLYGEQIFVLRKQQKDDSKIYSRKVSTKDHDLPVVIASKMLHSESRILDAGCSCGDNGIFLFNTQKAKLYGMEYNEASLARTREKTSIYIKSHNTDLNTFLPNEYPEYYKFFDYIMLMDVLEHLYSPYDVLQKMQVFLKKEGSFIISLPNISNIYPISNLLSHDFTYLDYGILDSTHIRFFTWKTIAISLAEWGFEILDSNVTFLSPDTRGMFTSKSLPQNFYEYLLTDLHFLVCQYVCKFKLSSSSFEVLKKNNLTQLELAIHNNPSGLENIGKDLDIFKNKLTLMQGRISNSAKIRQMSEMMSKDRYIETIILSGLFDETWYRKTYSEVNFISQHPLEHYLTQGWREGKNPSEAFNTNWFLKRYPVAAQSGICPLLFYLTMCLKAKLPYNRFGTCISEKELKKYTRHVLTQAKTNKDTFIDDDTTKYAAKNGDSKLIAFYLPQFTPFPENDIWWGKGFTEWTNVTKAVPQFVGHYQPRLPYDVGFYDLRVKEIRLRQEELAKKYGIYGFCYHYYWFDGKKIMCDPIENKLKDRDLSLPFCISWANESWSANWDGSKNNLLIDQPQNIKTTLLFNELLPYFKDERYIKVDNKPLFMIYRPAYFSTKNFKRFIKELRVLSQTEGIELHIVLGNTFRENEEKLSLHEYGADAFVEFPPHKFTMTESFDTPICNPNFIGRLFDLPELISIYKKNQIPKDLTYRTVFPMWDNTSRKSESGAMIYKNTTPEVYLDWLTHSIQMTRINNSISNNIVFINAWNEWAEGAYLEPDMKYGYAFLNMTRKAIHNSRLCKQKITESCIFISTFIDLELYKMCISNNKHIINNQFCKIYEIDNSNNNTCISKRYNDFLDQHDYNDQSWFIFCHSDWEICEDPSALLQGLDKSAIYGPIGAMLHHKNNTLIREYKGQCREKMRDGSNERILLCRSTNTADIVDTLDCQCVIIHSTLVEKYNLRFDEKLNFDLYVEDLCIAAKKNHGIQILILKIDCCHWNQADSLEGRETYYDGLKYLDIKYPNTSYAGVVTLIGGKRELDTQICTNIAPEVIYK